MARTKKNARPKSGAPNKSKRSFGKGKKPANSLYGPLSVPRQPSHQQWRLTSSMGGNEGKNTKLSKRQQKQIKLAKKSKMKSKKPSHRPNSFQLNMPNVSSKDPVVPWWRLQAQSLVETGPNSPKKRKMVQLAKGLAVPEASMARLNAELDDFCDYVSLAKTEVESRKRLVEQIRDACQTTFGILPYQVQVFGSFAALSVCTFESDVDLAIHGVVDPPPVDTIQELRNTDGDMDGSENEEENDRQYSHANQKKQERILRWKKALAEADIQEQTGDEMGAHDANGRQPSKSLASEEGSEEVEPLFVIDRLGCSDENESSHDPVKNPPGNKETITDDKNNELDEESNDSADKLEGLKDRNRNEGSAMEAGLLLDRQSGKNIPVMTKFPEKIDILNADETVNFKALARSANIEISEGEQEEAMETRPRSRSVVSLCSATTCSDTEDKAWDDSGLEVSFVAEAKATHLTSNSTSPPIGPTGETRAEVVRALNRLSKRLRRLQLAQHSHVRKLARVPIINMLTNFGYECDIAIGGHNGTDTSGYASTQCARFKSFSKVVLLLKVLLAQHDLDKPFTGGLGSFKLYVLVASHIEQHLALGGDDSPAEILIMFFFRYCGGNDRKIGDARLKTFLQQQTTVRTLGGRNRSGSGIADMGGVFKIENCVAVFEACFSKLLQKCQKISQNSSHSILGYLIDAKSLEEARETCRCKVTSSRSRKRPPNGRALPPMETKRAASSTTQVPRRGKKSRQSAVDNVFNPSENGVNRAGSKSDSPRSVGKGRNCRGSTIEVVDLVDTEQEANELRAAYGIKT